LDLPQYVNVPCLSAVTFYVFYLLDRVAAKFIQASEQHVVVVHQLQVLQSIVGGKITSARVQIIGKSVDTK